MRPAHFIAGFLALTSIPSFASNLGIGGGAFSGLSLTPNAQVDPGAMTLQYQNRVIIIWIKILYYHRVRSKLLFVLLVQCVMRLIKSLRVRQTMPFVPSALPDIMPNQTWPWASVYLIILP